jgi:hypothetical protein
MSKAAYNVYAAGGAATPTYIEDVFSTYLYTGNGSTQTITNGIDLSGKGGLVWIKDRDSGAKGHALFDTARGVNLKLQTQSTNGQFSNANQLTAFNTTGFNLGSAGDPNGSGTTYVSWTFREQPKFFDVVTYTGNGATYQDVTHSLGSTPGCIMVKCTSTFSTNWMVVHRSLEVVNQNLILNSTASASTVNSETITWATVNGSYNGFFRVLNSLGSSDPNNYLNVNGNTYVAYLFAHNAGGFGLTGSDNVITCGSASWSGGSDNVVNLGYEAQWVMYKRTDDVGNWMMWDTMRGMSFVSSEYLRANLSDAAATFTSPYAIYPNATGFTVPAGMVSTGTYIYIAIRRGPMKVPTTGTSVFKTISRTGTGSATTVTGVGFPPDLVIARAKATAGLNTTWMARLRGSAQLYSNFTSSGASSSTQQITSYDMDGISVGTDVAQSGFNSSGDPVVNWFLRRAPGFFSILTFVGDATTNRSINHNLGVTPELIITKSSNQTGNWHVGIGLLGWTYGLYLDTTNASSVQNWYSTPSSIAYSTGSSTTENRNSYEYIVYLFASCPGVSKVGSYTGNGSTQTIDCGFAAGARFVLIKRTDDVADWYVWDTVRGIISGNDPYLLINSTVAEVTNTDYIDPYSAGFELSSTAPAAINANGGTYIFLAIA